MRDQDFREFVMSASPALWRHKLDPAGTTGQPSIPDRVAAPSRFHPTAQDAPSGPASVIFGGTGWNPLFALDDEGDLAVVGARSDTYRIIHGGYEVHAGLHVVLSPDGTLVAQRSGMDRRGFGVLDLSTGRVKVATGFTLSDPTSGLRSDDVTPQAWSPDSKKVALHVLGGDETSSFALFDVGSGQVARIHPPVVGRPPDGWCFAFSADGTRFAYDEGGVIRVRDMDLAERSNFRPPYGAVIARKGAWSPDGTAIALLTRLPTGWELALHDVAHGGRLTDRVWTVEREFIAIRLMGWSPAGNPVVSAYLPEPGNTHRGLAHMGYRGIHSANVLELTHDGPKTLLTAQQHHVHRCRGGSDRHGPPTPSPPARRRPTVGRRDGHRPRIAGGRGDVVHEAVAAERPDMSRAAAASQSRAVVEQETWPDMSRAAAAGRR